jgi:hypothetical protein
LLKKGWGDGIVYAPGEMGDEIDAFSVDNSLQPKHLSRHYDPMDMDASVHAPPSVQPPPDPREPHALISRALVAERHSSLLDSENKRLELELQRLHSTLEHTLNSLYIFESETMRLELENDRLTSRIDEANYMPPLSG